MHVTGRGKPAQSHEPINEQISSFKCLCKNLREHLKEQLSPWNFIEEENHALLCKIDTTYTPKITASLKISRDLSVQVFLSNNTAEEASLEQFLGTEKVLRTWTQLQDILNFLTWSDIHQLKQSFDFHISDAFESLCRCLESIAAEELQTFEKKLRFIVNQIGLLSCASYLDIRLGKISCMDQFVPPHHPYRFWEAVQYCGYLAHTTKFGDTIRRRISLPNYNPWAHTNDLMTEQTCRYTKYHPGHYAPARVAWVTSKGWIISKCILKMLNLHYTAAHDMLNTCCVE